MLGSNAETFLGFGITGPIPWTFVLLAGFYITFISCLGFPNDLGLVGLELDIYFRD